MNRTIIAVRPAMTGWRIEANGDVVKELPERVIALARGRELAHMHHGKLICEDRLGRSLECDDYDG
jgi:hypothetical protein